MDKFIDDQPEFYKTASPAEQLSYIMFGSSGEDCTQDKYSGHMHLFTELSMAKALNKAGFKNITFVPEKHPEILDAGMSHSMCVECEK